MNFFGPYTTCPFDRSHRILDGRIQKHLFKCRKNYPKDAKLSCPFDATHVLNPEEYEHHLSTCPSSGNIKCYQQSFEEEKSLGTVSLEETCNVQTDTCCDEDWSGNNPTYNPITASENMNVMRTVVGLSKAKKKQFKRYERERIAKIENKHNNTIDDMSFTQKQPVLEAPLRMPKNAAKAKSLGQTSDNKDEDDVYIGDLISRLKKVDLENIKKDAWNTSLKKNVSTTSNSTSRESSNENSANNIPSEKSNSSSRSRQENISKKKINMTINDVKSYEKPKESDSKNSSILQHLNKEKNKHINSRIVANFGEARKISTGRGFTIAYQKIKSEISQEQGESTSLDHYNSVFGYEEDKNDDNDVASQTK